jgi:putative tryptophan/tyrosine transport system substrate-binding protein
MRRRDFIAAFAGAAAAWPLASRGQQPALPTIGFLSGASSGNYQPFVTAFKEGLKQTDYVEGQNVAIEYRWAEDQFDRLPKLAADLVDDRPTMIMASGNVAAVAAKNATATIPIVFTSGFDPIQIHLVASFNRPEGNINGVYTFSANMPTKSLELLHELVPAATGIGLLVNPSNPNLSEPVVMKEVEAAARPLGKQIHVVEASTDAEIDAAFSTLVQLRVGALVIIADQSYNDRRQRIAALALRHGLPSVYPRREYAVAGGLMSYGTSLSDIYRQAGVYAGRILKGAQPADLPIVQSTKLELVINLKTAKALGLTLPPSFYWRGDRITTYFCGA